MYRTNIKNFSIPILITVLVISLGLLIFAGCRRDTNKGSHQIYSIPGIGALANSYVVASDGEAAIIDPGQAEEILELIEDKSLNPRFILLTHGHFDHITGITEIIKKYPETEIRIHPADAKKLTDPETNVSALFGEKIRVPVPTNSIIEDKSIKLGKTTIQVIETPGHTSGSICLRIESDLLSGDTLMKNAVGRTNFPDGSPELLTDSIKRLKTLPEEINVFPGHGEPTTIGDELKSNPFIN